MNDQLIRQRLARRGAWMTHASSTITHAIYRGRTLAIHHGEPTSVRQRAELSQAARAGAVTATVVSVQDLERLLDRIDQHEEAV